MEEGQVPLYQPRLQRWSALFYRGSHHNRERMGRLVPLRAPVMRSIAVLVKGVLDWCGLWTGDLAPLTILGGHGRGASVVGIVVGSWLVLLFCFSAFRCFLGGGLLKILVAKFYSLNCNRRSIHQLLWILKSHVARKPIMSFFGAKLFILHYVAISQGAEFWKNFGQLFVRKELGYITDENFAWLFVFFVVVEEVAPVLEWFWEDVAAVYAEAVWLQLFVLRLGFNVYDSDYSLSFWRFGSVYWHLWIEAQVLESFLKVWGLSSLGEVWHLED